MTPEQDFRIGRDGRLYLPGFKYGFAPGELTQWHVLVRQRDAFAHKIEQMELRLARAEGRAAFYRWLSGLQIRHPVFNDEAFNTAKVADI